MHVISQKPFKDAAAKHPKYAVEILETYKVLRQGQYSSPEELKKVFNSLDNFTFKDKWWAIDIAGNNIRLMAFIEFRAGRMYVKHIVNHPEYDKLCKRYAKGEL
jgi:mRNA interferase HigB